MKMTILFVVLFASVAFSTPQPGLPFLLIWPTARSTALAGAVIGLADNPDAAFFNPAGLAFQSGIGAAANYGDWLPGFYPDMHFGYLSLVFSPKAENARAHHHLAIGLDASYLNLSNRYCIIPELPPPYPDVWRGAVGVAASFAVTGQFSVGAKAKLIQSELGTDLGMEVLPELGIDDAGTGTAWAGDVGALWRPSSRFSLGASVANLGPGITYSSTRQHDPSPTILRIGACWTLMDNRYVRLSIMPEWDKLLVGMLYDSGECQVVRSGDADGASRRVEGPRHRGHWPGAGYGQTRLLRGHVLESRRHRVRAGWRRVPSQLVRPSDQKGPGGVQVHLSVLGLRNRA